MKTKDLARTLVEQKFRSDMYSLEGGLPNEAHCLERRGDRWAVYYSERGRRSEERLFSTEDEACDFFLETLGE